MGGSLVLWDVPRIYTFGKKRVQGSGSENSANQNVQSTQGDAPAIMRFSIFDSVQIVSIVLIVESVGSIQPN
jgi:hypothetical protein